MKQTSRSELRKLTKATSRLAMFEVHWNVNKVELTALSCLGRTEDAGLGPAEWERGVQTERQRFPMKGSRHRLVSHRNLLGLPANPVHLPTSLETGLGANCAAPRSGSWFGRMAEQSPLTSFALDCELETGGGAAASLVLAAWRPHQDRQLVRHLLFLWCQPASSSS